MSSPHTPSDAGPLPPPDHAPPLVWAEWLVGRGLSCFPVKVDGSKEPALVGWRGLAARRPDPRELTAWFAVPGRYGIGVPGGPAGRLLVFDFEAEAAFAAWYDLLPGASRRLVERSPRVATPGGGTHVYARCQADPPPGRKLARTADGRCLIETRGSGHFVVAPGSPPACHPTGRRYRLAAPGWLALPDGADPAGEWPAESIAEGCEWAAALNRYTPPERVVGAARPRTAGATAPTGDRPGDRFNAAADWEAILRPAGWVPVRQVGDATHWRRPGKAAGVSATTGYCRSDRAGDLLYVFTTSAPPLEADTAYTRFGAYAVLTHGGDFAAAARTLARHGYGDPARRPARVTFGKGVAR